MAAPPIPFTITDPELAAALLYRHAGDRSDPEACWEWTGPTTAYMRYGVLYLPRAWRSAIQAGRDWLLAHRVSIALAGRHPGHQMVLHRCDNPPCINPGHLFLGSRADNMADARRKGRLGSAVVGRDGRGGTVRLPAGGASP